MTSLSDTMRKWTRWACRRHVFSLLLLLLLGIIKRSLMVYVAVTMTSFFLQNIYLKNEEWRVIHLTLSLISNQSDGYPSISRCESVLLHVKMTNAQHLLWPLHNKSLQVMKHEVAAAVRKFQFSLTHSLNRTNRKQWGCYRWDTITNSNNRLFTLNPVDDLLKM